MSASTRQRGKYAAQLGIRYRADRRSFSVYRGNCLLPNYRHRDGDDILLVTLLLDLRHCPEIMAGRINLETFPLHDFEPLLRNQYTWASLLVLVILCVLSLQPKSGNETIDAPIVGSRQSWIARWRFFSNAGRVIKEGYSEVVLQMADSVARTDIALVQDRNIQAQRARHGHSADQICRRAA